MIVYIVSSRRGATWLPAKAHSGLGPPVNEAAA
jgi:hypothetical protein